MPLPDATPPVRIALVEDVADLRRRFRERVQFYDRVALQFVAVHGAHFFDELGKCAPDALPQVVLMDIEMPVMDGIEATRRLCDTHPGIEVMMLTVFDEPARIFEAIQAGASGYLLKQIAGRSLTEAIRDVAAGRSLMDPAVTGRLLEIIDNEIKPAYAVLSAMT